MKKELLKWMILLTFITGSCFRLSAQSCDYPLPEPPFIETSLCSAGTAQFVIIDSTHAVFQWADDSTLSAKRYFSLPGVYNLLIRNDCETKFYDIFISNCDQDPYVPTAFSPNNDGLNDMFRARGPSLKWILLEVFNRKGEKVFSGNQLSDFWDGTYKGVEAPAGLYLWRLSAGTIAGRRLEMKGEVVLVR